MVAILFMLLAVVNQLGNFSVTKTALAVPEGFLAQLANRTMDG